MNADPDTTRHPPAPDEVPVVRIVDDDPAIRDAVSMLLVAHGYRVRTFDCGRACLDDPDLGDPGCILLDVRMPGMDGLAVLEELIAVSATTPPVVMISGHADVPLAVRAVKAGALDVLEKPFDPGTLFAAVGAALAVDTASRARKRASETPFETLTPREREVMDLLVTGAPTKAIARQLGISPRTAEVHRAHVMQKVGVESIARLVALANARDGGSGSEG